MRARRLTSPLVALLFCDGRGCPIGFFSEVIVKFLVAGQTFPVRPFRRGGDLLRRLDGFPFGGRDDSDEIPLHDDLRIREL